MIIAPIPPNTTAAVSNDPRELAKRPMHMDSSVIIKPVSVMIRPHCWIKSARGVQLFISTPEAVAGYTSDICTTSDDGSGGGWTRAKTRKRTPGARSLSSIL